MDKILKMKKKFKIYIFISKFFFNTILKIKNFINKIIFLFF
jgi:hypothetical protein